MIKPTDDFVMLLVEPDEGNHGLIQVVGDEKAYAKGVVQAVGPEAHWKGEDAFVVGGKVLFVKKTGKRDAHIPVVIEGDEYLFIHSHYIFAKEESDAITNAD